MTLPSIVAGMAVACACAYLASGWEATPAGDTDDPSAATGLAAGHEIASPETPLPARAVLVSRYRLQGVAADSAAEGSGGIALIAVDGAVARAFRVGDAVGSELVLLGVSPGGAILASPGGTPMVALDVTPGTSTSQVHLEGSPAVAAGTAPVPTPDLAPSAAQMPAPRTEPTVPQPAADISTDNFSPAAHPNVSRQAPGRRLRLHRQSPGP